MYVLLTMDLNNDWREVTKVVLQSQIEMRELRKEAHEKIHGSDEEFYKYIHVRSQKRSKLMKLHQRYKVFAPMHGGENSRGITRISPMKGLVGKPMRR